MSRYNYAKASSYEKDDSDISEADGNEIAKILKETDELDGDIFKGYVSTKSSLSKTMPASLTKPPQPPPSPKISNPGTSPMKKMISFDDDVLGGDLDALIEKKKTNTSLTVDKKPPLAAQHQISTQVSTASSKKSAFTLDEDDLGIFDDKRTSRSNSRAPDQQAKSKSLVDDLFGRSNNNEVGSTALSSQPTEFKLSDKYTKLQSQESHISTTNRAEEDSFSFGGYVPSAISTTSRSISNPNQQRRNVGFSDDLFNADLFSVARPKTSPAQPVGNKSRDESPMMRTMPTPSKSSDDWLGLSNDGSGKFNTKKDSIFDETLLKPKVTPHQPQQSQQQQLSQTMPSSLLIDSSRTSKGFEQSLPFKTQPTTTKDSMNSSFADSVDMLVDQTTKPSATSSMLNNRTAVATTITTTNHPAQIFDTQQSKIKDSDPIIGGSIAPSEIDDGWLNNLMNNNSNKKPSSGGGANPLNSNRKIPVSNVSYDSNEIQAMIQKIKQLEYENQDLHMQLQHNKAHYELQIQLIQDGYEERVRVMKEDRETSLKQFREEKESLKNHIELVEKEKQELSNIYKRKLDESQREYDTEIERLRQIQRESIEKLKDEHEEVIRRIKKFKETELDAAMTATSHTRKIENVINLIEDNTKNLDSLNQKIQMGHMVNLNDFEAQLKTKQENLRIQEEKVNKQQKEYESEIRQLNATIQRLENHLAEQSKLISEERWKGKQQEKKLEALQEALFGEQRIIMEKLARERNDIDRTKEEILQEQKKLMQQVYEEKRKIAEEKAHLEATMSAYNDKKHKDSLSNINLEAELTVNSKRLHEEKVRLERFAKELDDKDAQLRLEKAKLDERKNELDAKMAKLEQMAFSVNQKFEKAEELMNKSNKEKDAQMKILDHANQIKSTHESRLNQIQQQLMLLSEREAQINQEKILVLKQRQELDLLKSKITCTKCKEPVKDFSQAAGFSLPSSGYGTALFSTLNSSLLKIQQPSFSNGFSHMADLEEAKQLRHLKMQALKDRQFINEEKQFIDTLKSNNTFTLRSMSMNQLDSTIS